MTHTVKKGDTLSAIAVKYGVSVSAIKNANSSIKDVDKLKIGQVITIPNKVTVKKQLNTCLKDIQNLPSYKKLVNLLKG